MNTMEEYLLMSTTHVSDELAKEIEKCTNNEERFCIQILGPRGVGKTALAKAVASRFAQNVLYGSTTYGHVGEVVPRADGSKMIYGELGRAGTKIVVLDIDSTPSEIFVNEIKELVTAGTHQGVTVPDLVGVIVLGYQSVPDTTVITVNPDLDKLAN
jgi:SpoVK/Ycf46/Vps4 family AAA+-type ATPase